MRSSIDRVKWIDEGRGREREKEREVDERVCGFIDLSIWNGFLSSAPNNLPLVSLVTLVSVRHSFLCTCAKANKSSPNFSISASNETVFFSTLFSTLYSPFLQSSKFPWNFTNNTNLWSTALVILGYTIGQISISKKKFRGENFGIKFHGTFDRLTSILFLSRRRKFEVEERVYEVEGDGQRSVTRSGSRVIDGQEGSSLGGSRSFLFVKGPTSILSISSASRKIPHSRRGERLPRD